MTTVSIIRHTRVAEAAGRCYGQYEMPLADTFEEEMVHYESLLSVPSLVYSSPLSRCLRLAEALPFHAEIVQEPALMEVNFGEWEGKLWDVIPQAELNPWMADFVEVAPPQGESLREMYGRVAAFLDRLRKVEKEVLLVTHAGVIRCVWAYVLQVPLHNVFKIPVSFGEVMRVKLGREPSLDAVLQKG